MSDSDELASLQAERERDDLYATHMIERLSERWKAVREAMEAELLTLRATCHRLQAEQETLRQQQAQRIQDYLCTGGLFNPELMEHGKVRDLLLDLCSARNVVVENLDMLQVDRLRNWATNIETYGPDITYWGSVYFVVPELRCIADSMEAVVKGTPPANLSTLRQQQAETQQERDHEKRVSAEWFKRVQLTEAQLATLRASLRSLVEQWRAAADDHGQNVERQMAQGLFQAASDSSLTQVIMERHSDKLEALIPLQPREDDK